MCIVCYTKAFQCQNFIPDSTVNVNRTPTDLLQKTIMMCVIPGEARGDGIRRRVRRSRVPSTQRGTFNRRGLHILPFNTATSASTRQLISFQPLPDAARWSARYRFQREQRMLTPRLRCIPYPHISSGGLGVGCLRDSDHKLSKYIRLYLYSTSQSVHRLHGMTCTTKRNHWTQ